MFSPAPATLFTTIGATSMIDGAASGTATCGADRDELADAGHLELEDHRARAARLRGPLLEPPPVAARVAHQRPNIGPGSGSNLEAAFRGCRCTADGAVRRCRDRDDGAGNGRPRFVADLSGQGGRGYLRLDQD